jgi:hypothetical protein
MYILHRYTEWFREQLLIAFVWRHNKEGVYGLLLRSNHKERSLNPSYFFSLYP